MATHAAAVQGGKPSGASVNTAASDASEMPSTSFAAFSVLHMAFSSMNVGRGRNIKQPCTVLS